MNRMRKQNMNAVQRAAPPVKIINKGMASEDRVHLDPTEVHALRSPAGYSNIIAQIQGVGRVK